ncbi:uroporphyrinogen-III C-methyltransferase [Alkalihalobacillus sp. 1P02AB]|uniref:uroporphyrinogen-III C-methyltransferase n=1 Tax=Alkalihalobacillus sp. 1P02AB TaxID=3132260 RepID=UPI0039A78549
MQKQGIVYLVGAGPGDIRLLTMKGYEVLQKADVVLYDRLIHPLLLEWTKPDAEIIYCGKLPDRHLLRQEAINDLLVKKGQEGKIVVRLKGGDPSVFGRVAEEANALQEASVPFEIVPGITAGIGASTYAGISVTHRDYGGSFAVVTGHNKTASGEPTIDWQALSKGVDTIAFYMGVKNLPYISENLLLNGKAPDTPVSIIQWGTLGKQKVLKATLKTVAKRAIEEKVENPAITLVGDVNHLRQEKSWFEKQPLFGQHILFARTDDEPSSTVESLRDLGAEVFEYPRFQIRFSKDEPIDYRSYECIYFLSSQSVKAFFKHITDIGLDIRFIQADFVVRSKKSAKLLSSYACSSLTIDEMEPGKKVLVLGEEMSEQEQSSLKEKIGDFDYFISYQKELVSQSSATFERLWDEGRIETLVFPNEKSVVQVTEALAKTKYTPTLISKNVEIICYGPTSYQKATELGYIGAKVLEHPTKEELIQELGYSLVKR